MTAWRQVSPTGKALLLGVFLTGLTTYMFLPLLAVQLTRQGFTATQAGLVIGVLAFTTQAFALVVGLVVDRFGPRLTMALGIGLRIAGYLLLMADHTRMIALPVLAAVAIGLGGGLLGIAIKSQLVDEPAVPPRSMLALRSTFINVGVIAGPALGALASGIGFALILACCIASHLVLGVRLFFAFRAEPAEPAAASGSDEAESAPLTGFFALFERRLLAFAVLSSVAYYALYAQVNLSLPLIAERLTGHYFAISILFTINGVVMVACQYVLLGHVFKAQTPPALLVIGFGAFAAAFGALVFAHGWTLLVGFVLLATLAEMLIGPSLDEQVIRNAPLRRRAFVLGLVAAGGAVGSLLGSSLGGYLYQHLSHSGAVWIVFVVVALAGVGLNLTGTAAPEPPAEQPQPLTRPRVDSPSGSSRTDPGPPRPE
jgi:MFS family permease